MKILYSRLSRLGFHGAVALLSFASTQLVGAPEKQPLKKIQLGYNAGSIMGPLVVIADQAGLFKKEGLDVELLNMGTEGVVSVNQRKILAYPFGVGGLQWVAKRGDVVFYGGTMNEGGVFFARPDEADKFRDLTYFRGKKVAAPRLASGYHSLLDRIAAAGVDIKKDVQSVEMDSGPAIIEAVVKGLADIGFTSIEQAQVAQKRGLKIAFYAGEFAPNYVCCKQIGNRKDLAEKRDIYVALLRAQIQAYKIYLEDRERTINYLIDYSNQTREFVINVLYTPDAFKHFIVTPDPYANKIRTYYKILEDEGVFERGVNINDYIDTTIYKDALDQVLKEHPDDPVYRKLLADYPLNNLSP